MSSRTNVPHLHVHSMFSMLDGVPSPSDYLSACDSKGIPALAFTEHGNMGSHAEASIESRNFKTKTILGMEAYVVNDVGKMQEVRKEIDQTRDKDKKEVLKAERDKFRKSGHLVLLAKDAEGYGNLVSINNHSWTSGFYFRNRTDFRTIAAHSHGLIALSACQSGLVSRYLLMGKRKTAVRIAKLMKKIFGSDFYLELQFLDMKVQDKLNKMLVELSHHLDIPLVITNDVHYVNEGDHKIQQVLIQLATRGSMTGFSSKVNYLKTLEDFENDFRAHGSVPRKEFVSCIDNTFRIADQCNHIVKTGALYFPEFDHTTHFLYNRFSIADKTEFFKRILVYRAKSRLRGLVSDRRYKERLSFEFSTLKKLGGLDYFFIVDDLLNYVREQGAFSMIRGSANGSLIAFVFGFGLIDPIKHGILFERFVSKYRSLNDIDIDIDVRSEFRQRALAYLRDKYGYDRVLTVGTYNRMQLKGAIKDVTRVFKERIDRKIEATDDEDEATRLAEKQREYSYPNINRLTAPMDGALTLGKAIGMYEPFKLWYEKNRRIVKKYIAPIVGNVRNVSMHPAGVIILPDGMTSLLPVRTQADPHIKDERVTTTVWENSHTSREDLNEVGVMALDILGVKTLSVVSDVIDLIKATRGVELDLYELDLEDKKTLKQFNKHETLGVFQFSGGAASQIVGITKITEFNDLIVINALARPGALQAKAEVAYSERKVDKSLVEYDHHSLSTILNDSLGVLVFSEHILRTASEFAGMHPKKADNLRKIIKGKNPAVFKAYKKEFISGARKKWRKEPGIKDTAERIWEKFSQAGSYLFPRGHATSYALLGYICMYLKVHYPVEFFACHLQYQPQDKYGRVKEVAEGAYKVKFHMPTITSPKLQFEASGNGVWWPLTALKSVGAKAVASIVEEAPFTSLQDFYDRVDKRVCNKRVVENLIVAGVFREFGNKRAVMMAYKKLRKDKDMELPDVFASRDSMAAAMENVYGFEVQSIGNLFKKELKNYGRFTTWEEFNDALPGDTVKVYGRVVKVSPFKTKNGDPMAFTMIKNGKHEYSITLFPEALRLAKQYFQKGNVLVVSGAKNVYRNEGSIVLNTNRAKVNLAFAKGSWVKQL